MRESITYQIILEEGRDEGRLTEARRNVLEMGAEKFGSPDSATAARVDRIADLDTLHQLMLRIFHVTSWHELLALAPER